MTRKEFQRVTPEIVGIPSGVILRLIEELESITEMHGLMIMRRGKVCTECWWAPYAPGIRHGCQSLTKTYAATAIGIAFTEGLLKLEDRMVDIFPEYLPENPSENLKKMRIRDVLCMGCGMDDTPEPTSDWIKSFFSMPVNHKPGSVFMYNNMASTILVAIIKKITGLGLHDYLRPRLYDRIGIDADNLKWTYMPDGLEFGGAGLYATTEDNLRLMQLYLQKGIWENERLLSDEYVTLAGSRQIETTGFTNCGIDNLLGYGFQTWMSQPEGVYRADGAFGQFSIVFPDLDMVISMNETILPKDNESQKLSPLDAVYDNLLPYIQPVSLAENKVQYDKLIKKISSISLKNPLYMPFSKKIDEINSKRYVVREGNFTLFEDPLTPMFTTKVVSTGIKHFAFNFSNSHCKFSFLENGKEESLEIGIDGSRRFCRLYSDIIPVNELYLNGAWLSEDTFEVVARWIETCYEKKLCFKFTEQDVEIMSTVNITCSQNILPHIVKASMV